MKLHRRFSKTLLVAIAIPLLFLSISFAQSRAARTAIGAGAAGPKTGNQPGAKQARETQPSAGQSLPLRRVTLYSNGVAYFERRGTVTGRAEIDLSFKQSQVDDVLKSLVVLDLGRGRVGAVSYNSSAPPSARLNEIPFSIDASTNGDPAGGLAGVLEQLQGARVAVTAANRVVTGAVLTVGERQLPTEKEKPAVKTHTLVITTDSGELQSFDLNDVRAIKLLDEGARQDITQFASASASARRRDAKTITVTSEGDGQREMVISYTIAAPIWKTTYRVVLDPEGKPFFQGWAVVHSAKPKSALSFPPCRADPARFEPQSAGLRGGRNIGGNWKRLWARRQRQRRRWNDESGRRTCRRSHAQIQTRSSGANIKAASPKPAAKQ
jgi:hypothetical protein